MGETIIPDWALNVPKLMPHSDGVEDVHGASATPSQFTSSDSYQN